MDNLPKAILGALLNEVKRASPQAYRNSSGVIQSSVGLILRETVQGPTQVLMVQRSGFEGDRNAYNIVFPGGQCDGEETDLEACERELNEEVSLKVEESCEYLGQLPSNFYYLRKRGKKVYITCHLWRLKPAYILWEPTLNLSELRAARWVPFPQLVDRSHYVNADSLRLGIIDRMGLPQIIASSINQNLTKVSLPELQVGMDRNLWGLTLWLWGYVLQMAQRNLVDQAKSGGKVELHSLTTLEGEISHIKGLQLSFKPWYWLKYPVLGAVKAWHSLYRVQPFTYQRVSERRANKYLVGLVVVVTLCWLFLI